MTPSADADARFARICATQPAGPHPPVHWAVDPVTVAKPFLFTSGQVPFTPSGLLNVGVVGRDVDLDQARACARQCMLNLLARTSDRLGSLNAIAATLKLTVFVASVHDFTDQPTVADEASRVLVDVLGDAGRHARAAVGVAALPLGSPVEVEAAFLLDLHRATRS